MRELRIAEMADSYRTAVLSSVLSALLGVVLAGVIGYLVRRSAVARQRQEWLQTGQVGLSAMMLGDQNAEQLGDAVLRLSRALSRRPGGRRLCRASGDSFRRVSTYGAPPTRRFPSASAAATACLDRPSPRARTLLIENVPDGYLVFGSALGRDKPRHLVIAPARVEGAVNAVVELGFMRPVEDLALAFLDLTSEAIAIAVRSANYRSELQRLVEETQRQSEELQVQSEELRVNNEELEEQSRALKESQVRLEQQQVELEQTNSQLEEQAQQLEAQRDDLERANSRDPGQGDGGRAGEPLQVRLPRQHVA